MASPLRTSCGILRGPPRVVGVTCLVLQQHRVCVCVRARVRLCVHIAYGVWLPGLSTSQGPSSVASAVLNISSTFQPHVVELVVALK